MDTVKMWDIIAATPMRQTAISPAPDYAASGIAHAQALLDLVPNARDLVCVDFGCGDGRVSVPLADAFDHVICTDSSPTMLANVPERPNISTLLYQGPWDEPAADVVYSMSVFIHNTYADGCLMLRDIATMLVPGGWAYLQIPLYDSRVEPASWTDVGTWTPADLTDACAYAGLTVVEMATNPGHFAYTAVGPNHGRLHRLRRDA